MSSPMRTSEQPKRLGRFSARDQRSTAFGLSLAQTHASIPRDSEFAVVSVRLSVLGISIQLSRESRSRQAQAQALRAHAPRLTGPFSARYKRPSSPARLSTRPLVPTGIGPAAPAWSQLLRCAKYGHLLHH